MDTSQLKNLASQALQNAFGSVPDPSRRFGQSIPTPEYLPGTAGMFVQPYELEEVTPEGERIDYSVMLENLKRSIPVDIASTPGYVADIYNLPSSVGEYLNLRFRGRPEEAAAVEFFPRGSQSSELAEQAVTEFYGSPAPEFPNIQTEVATRGAQIFADPFAAVGWVKYLGALGRAARDVFTPTSPEELAAMQRLGITADSAPAASRMGEKQETGLYSALETAARDLPQQKGSGQQMLAMIQKQAGVKPEEVQWTGLDEFLKSKPTVTKGEIEDYLLNNRVELQEVRLESVNPYPYKTGDEWQAAVVAAERRRDWDEVERLHNAWEAEQGHGPAGAPKFERYTLPGGENYREVLLTLPSNKQSRLDKINTRYNEIVEEYGVPIQDLPPKAKAEIDRLTEEHDKIAYATEEIFRSSHYDQPNILAHVRLNDRIDADGKRVLFVEEVQSDWHQAGRKSGYVGGEKHHVAYYDTPKGPVEIGYGKTAEEAIANADPGWKGLVEIKTRAEKIKEGEGVPDAPFKTSWHELALRRIMQEAAEKGYDRIAFTKGAQQAQRYDLSKQVDSIAYMPDGKGTYKITAYKDGEAVVTESGKTPEQLEDIVGKEMAQKIAKGEGKAPESEWAKSRGVMELTGTDLQVGGAGMKGFYDQILPKSLNKLGKKFDAKVGTTNLQTGDEVWSMDITPKMRKTAKEQGMPLFSAAPIGIGVGAQYQGMESEAQPVRPEQFIKIPSQI